MEIEQHFLSHVFISNFEYVSEAYSKPFDRYKIKRFAKIVNGF